MNKPFFEIMAQWLSWLERRPVTAEVVGSNPIWVASKQAMYLSHCLFCFICIFIVQAAVAELADARDLKSRG